MGNLGGQEFFWLQYQRCSITGVSDPGIGKAS